MAASCYYNMSTKDISHGCFLLKQSIYQANSHMTALCYNGPVPRKGPTGKFDLTFVKPILIQQFQLCAQAQEPFQVNTSTNCSVDVILGSVDKPNVALFCHFDFQTALHHYSSVTTCTRFDRIPSCRLILVTQTAVMSVPTSYFLLVLVLGWAHSC